MPQTDPVDPQSTKRPLEEDIHAEKDIKAAPSGFGRLAKRISAWTTNCILTVIVLVIGVAFGRQVLDWWAPDVPQPTVLPIVGSGDLADPAASHQFAFGDNAWHLVRQPMTGDRTAATEALRSTCLGLTPTAAIPPGEVGPSEKKFLDSIAQQSPAAEEPGQWRFFEFEGLFPMAAGTRPLGGNNGSARNQVAESGSRVVTWAIAVPRDEKEWMLYAFHSPSPSGKLLPGLPDTPIPPESTKLLSMRTAGGATAISFQGIARVEHWKRFYDQWFQARGWSAMGDWRTAAGGWHRRYTESSGSVEVRFGPNANGGTSGLLLITPPDGVSMNHKKP